VSRLCFVARERARARVGFSRPETEPDVAWLFCTYAAQWLRLKPILASRVAFAPLSSERSNAFYYRRACIDHRSSSIVKKLPWARARCHAWTHLATRYVIRPPQSEFETGLERERERERAVIVLRIMLHNVTHTINYATIFVLNYARKLGILTLISTITFRLAYARGLWIWRCRIANAQMVDSADPLMIINETASNGDGCHCKISSIHPSVRFASRYEIRYDDATKLTRRAGSYPRLEPSRSPRRDFTTSRFLDAKLFLLNFCRSTIPGSREGVSSSHHRRSAIRIVRLPSGISLSRYRYPAVLARARAR